MNTNRQTVKASGNAPKETMREFFNRADVRALQDIQKRNVFWSKAHIAATRKLEALIATARGDK